MLKGCVTVQSVLGRLGEEMLRLSELGVPYEVVPGVSASIAAPICAGIPVTHRGVADSFVVLTAHRKLDATSFSIPSFSARSSRSPETNPSSASRR